MSMRMEKVVLLLAASLAAGPSAAQMGPSGADLNGPIPEFLRFAPSPGAVKANADLKAAAAAPAPRTWGGRPMPAEPEKLTRLAKGSFNEEVRAWDYSDSLHFAIFGYSEEDTLRKLKGYKFLLIPGLGHKAPYFEETLASLRTVDPQAEVVEVARHGLIAANAATVAEAIRRRGDKVIVLAHSKGGLDLLAALEADERLSKNVELIGLLQTPYWGSPLGDSTFALAVRDFLAYLGVKEMIGRTRELLAEVGNSKRANQKSLPPSLTRKIFSLATSLDKADPRRSDPRFLVLPRESDGTVPLAHAIVPCTRYGVFANVGHMDTVRPRKGAPAPASPGGLTLGVLRWMLDNRNAPTGACS